MRVTVARPPEGARWTTRECADALGIKQGTWLSYASGTEPDYPDAPRPVKNEAGLWEWDGAAVWDWAVSRVRKPPGFPAAAATLPVGWVLVESGFDLVDHQTVLAHLWGSWKEATVVRRNRASVQVKPEDGRVQRVSVARVAQRASDALRTLCTLTVAEDATGAVRVLVSAEGAEDDTRILRTARVAAQELQERLSQGEDK